MRVATALALAFATQVQAYDVSDDRKTAFPEAFTGDVALWMDGEYAFGASQDMTILKRTEQGFRFVYIDTPMIFGDDKTDEALAGRKPARCLYDIPEALGRRILDAARAVLRRTPDGGDNDNALLGKHYEFFARDGAKALHVRIANPRGDSEPAMLASVLTPFGNDCPHHALQQEGDLESSLGQLERHLRREKQR